MEEVLTTRLRQAYIDSMPLQPGLEPHLKDALERILRNPGSLVRPGLVMCVADGFGLAEAPATEMAISLEYFHTASLLFDDLPAMDDAVERRGLPCVHVEYGDAGAILAALALVNRAYGLAWRAIAAGTPDRQRRALDYLECHLGVDGLLNGQSMDLHYASLPHDQHTTERTAIGKTVSLIRLTLVLPAMVAGASEKELHLLERIALFWGLSYQIVDDLKDVLQTSNESGKTAAQDQMNGRPNLALTMGVERAAERLQRLIALGDRSMGRLIALRPGIAPLHNLRMELGIEARQLTESVLVPATGGSR